MDVNSFVIGYTKGKQSAGGGGSMEGFHKVRFFNDDRTTLLYTVFVPTGASAMYAGDTPISTGGVGIFSGFEPSPVSVTADIDCYAVYTSIGTLDETSWASIAKVSADGTARNYFAIGDTKMIHIEGKVGQLSCNGDYGVYIIGFDHNSDVEGSGITFGTFKSAVSNGIDLALKDTASASGGTSGDKYFNINHWGETNHGGWAGCDLRYDVLGSTDAAPSNYGSKPTDGRTGYNPTADCASLPVKNTLMAALPDDLRAVMKPMTKYTDNVGGAVNAEESVYFTTDYLPLLAEFEIHGGRKYANVYERNKQKQYEYFASGNSKIKYSHSNINSSVQWWTRSSYSSNDSGFCVSTKDGIAEFNSCKYVYSLAPIFKV